MVIADIEGDTVKGIVSSVSDPFGSIVFNIAVKDFVKAGFAHGDMVHVLLQDHLFLDSALNSNRRYE